MNSKRILLELAHKIINIRRKRKILCFSCSISSSRFTVSMLMSTTYIIHNHFFLFFCSLFIRFRTRHERIQSNCLLWCVGWWTETKRNKIERTERAERENTVNVINEYETHCCERKNTQMFIIVAVEKSSGGGSDGGGGDGSAWMWFCFCGIFFHYTRVCIRRFVCLAKKQQLLFMASLDSLYFILTLFLALTLEIGDVEYCFGAFSLLVQMCATLPEAQRQRHHTKCQDKWNTKSNRKKKTDTNNNENGNQLTCFTFRILSHWQNGKINFAYSLRQQMVEN